MSVLDRWGRLPRDRADAVAFITRNLPPAELARLYKEIDDFSLEADAKLIVIPCDEFGICPEYRTIAEGVRELPARFEGIRPWLRRKLCEAYGCRPAGARGDKTLNTALEALQIAEGRLLMAKDMIRSVEVALAEVPDRDERLRGPRAVLNEAREAYAEALSQYYEVWSTSRRLSPTRSCYGANPQTKDTPV